MKPTKELRSTLRFAPENNQHGGDWATDWDTGVKYVAPTPGLFINEGGAIQLTSISMRDPHGRHLMLSRYGIDLRYVEDLPTLMRPDGTKIPKNTLLGSTYLIHADGRRARVYDVTESARRPECNTYATWYHLDGYPSVKAPVRTRERNKAREVEWLASMKDDLLRAQGAFALSEFDERGRAIRRWPLTEVVAKLKSSAAPTARVEEFFVALGSYWADGKQRLDITISVTSDMKEYDHLLFA